MHMKKKSLWLKSFALAASTVVGGCTSATTEDPTTTVSEALEAASNSSDAVEVADLLRGLNGPQVEAVEGFHCDASPDITYAEVCGKSLPATVKLEWTDCAAPQRGGRGGHPRGGPPPSGGADGGMPPPPPGGGEGGRMGGEGHAHGPSSGTVEIASTYSTPEGCEGAIVQEQSVSFQISRTGEDGSVATAQGTTASTLQLVADAPPQKKATQADVTRTLTDASGAVVRSVHLTGAMSVEFSSDTPPTRTINGAYAEAFADGTQGSVTLAAIVRPPRNVCPWPVSGTLTRATADGQSHTLVFGPECGAATLDGTAVELPEHQRRERPRPEQQPRPEQGGY
jgi:hypothetical protein